VSDGGAARAALTRRRDRLATPATALALGAVMVLLAAAYVPITLRVTSSPGSGTSVEGWLCVAPTETVAGGVPSG
jgi:hypothetical protein